MQGQNPADLSSDIRTAIREGLPQAEGAPITVLATGWDSVAVDVGGALVCKFPRSAHALARLRREVRVLAALQGRLTLPIPDPRLIDGPRPFSVYRKLPGDRLLPGHYPALPEAARARLAEDLARFHAELHAIAPGDMAAAGAGPIDGGDDPQAALAAALPLLPPDLRPAASRAVSDWAALPQDRQVYGHFDAHGWNMAFDHATRRLNGVYDFADSGLGPLHRDFVPVSFTSPDLARRIVAAYGALTGTPPDPVRVHLATGLVRLRELADAPSDPAMLANLRDWAGWPFPV